MASPIPGDRYVNIPLTNIAIAYLQKSTQFVSDKVFPIVPTALQGGLYFTYGRGDFFRVESRERAPGAESVGKDYKLATQPFYNRVYAVHKDVSDQERATAIDPLGPDRGATELVMLDMLLKRETDWAAAFFRTGVWGTDITGVASAPGAGQVLQWDATNATPIIDIKRYVRLMQATTGYKPNTLVISPMVAESLFNNASIIDRIKYVQAAFPDTAILATAFGIDQVYVADAVVNTAAEGATDANAFVLGKGALLTYAAPAPSLLAPSAGYTFVWQNFLGNAGGATRVKKFRMEWLESDRVEAEAAYQQAIVAPELGTFFTSIIA